MKFSKVIKQLIKLERSLHPKQRKTPFKVRYDLNRRQPISEFEKKMAEGMFREGKEVFVTAFCTEVEVLSVTATIGSNTTCRPSDNVYNWGEKAQKIGATQIRQYHNHPPAFGRSFSSKADKKSHQAYKELVESFGITFRSLLIFKRRLGGYVIKEIG